MSEPANLLEHANELSQHGQNLQEIGRKLEELARTLREASAAWKDERVRAAEIQARLTAQLAQATRGISIDVNVGVNAGLGPPHPRASVNTRVDYPGGNGTGRVIEEISE